MILVRNTDDYGDDDDDATSDDNDDNNINGNDTHSNKISDGSASGYSDTMVHGNRQANNMHERYHNNKSTTDNKDMTSH